MDDPGRRPRRRGVHAAPAAGHPGTRADDRAAPPRGARLTAWRALAFSAGVLAALGAARWAGALLSDAPILYGEGAVANAAFRWTVGLTYRELPGDLFVAANYPPLYYAIAALAGPFLAGRVAGLVATAVVAALLFTRARAAGLAAACGIAGTWLACVPVLDWAPAVKPDLVAVAFTAAAVGALEAPHRRAGAAGALLVLAVATKPTALLPALAIVALLAARDRVALGGLVAGVAMAAVPASAMVALLGPQDVWRHVVSWNALPWDPGQAGLLVVLALLVLGLPIALAARVARDVRAAYLVGAAAIALLGGREGASINYLLDLAAASALALAAAAPRLPRAAPLALAAQLLVAIAFLDPFGVAPWGGVSTGHWSSPSRVSALRDAVVTTSDAPMLVEDSGLLFALRREVVLDDLFLWSRLASNGLIEPAPVIDRARRGAFPLVVAETDLARIASAPAYERARWHPALVAAVLERYALDRTVDGLWLYRPR